MPDRIRETRIVPVFPLPGTVFFPQTTLGLHVFEPRYRAMVRDATAGDRRIAIALLAPGWESNYEDRPVFHRVGTVGRIEDLHPLEDGRFLLRLIAIERVRFTPVPSEKPYQLARVEPLPESAVDEDSAEVKRAKVELMAAHGCLLRELQTERGESVVLDDATPFSVAVNTACAGLPVEASVRQELLEENDLLERQRKVAALTHRVLETVLRLKSARTGGSGTSGVLN